MERKMEKIKNNKMVRGKPLFLFVKICVIMKVGVML